MSTVLTKTFAPMAVCEKEILRYAGQRDSQIDKNTKDLLDECINESSGKLVYKVCYRSLPVKVEGDLCDFQYFSLKSKNLSKTLCECNEAIVFAATIGVEIDRLIAKYGRISPAKALMFQAIGAERIEALCDEFCKSLEANQRPRFSPGYGDLSLDSQRKIFDILDCPKNIGLTLTESFLMSPSKSVTAIVGLSNLPTNNEKTTNKCSLCKMDGCAYRGTK